MFWPLVSLWYLSGSFVSVTFLFAGEWLMSLQFQRVPQPPKWTITEKFPQILSEVFELLVSIRLGRLKECGGVLPTTRFAYWKILAFVMPICV